MKSTLLFLSVALLVQISVAQVGIGTITPANGTLLHVDDGLGNKGVLIPKVEITNLSTAAPLDTTIEVGTLVFNETGSNAIGFYYWSGSSWVKLSTTDGPSENIYNTDGTLTGTRTLAMNGNELRFSAGDFGSNLNRALKIIPPDPNNIDDAFVFDTNHAISFITDGSDPALEIGPDSNLNFGQYGLGNVTGTATYTLAVTNTGDVVEQEYFEPYSAKFTVDPQFTEGGANEFNINNVYSDNSNEIPLFGTTEWNDAANYTSPGTNDIDENDLIINASGRYRITVNLSLESTAGRANVDFLIEISRGDIDIFPGAKHSNNYIRNSNNHNNSSVSFTEILELQAGDDLSVLGIQEAANGNVYLRSDSAAPGVTSNIVIEGIK